jgi:hypothetical protein
MTKIRQVPTRFLLMLSAFVLVFGALAVVPASPAAAESWSAWTVQYPYAHNGCTNVTDTPGGFSFTDACNRHDGCYGGRWASRATCDQWFLNDMLNKCRKYDYQLVARCGSYAYSYYWGVRWFGQKYYDSHGVLVRISTRIA